MKRDDHLLIWLLRCLFDSALSETRFTRLEQSFALLFDRTQHNVVIDTIDYSSRGRLASLRHSNPCRIAFFVKICYADRRPLARRPRLPLVP